MFHSAMAVSPIEHAPDRGDLDGGPSVLHSSIAVASWKLKDADIQKVYDENKQKDYLRKAIAADDTLGWPWIALLVRHVALDYVRVHAEYRRAPAVEEGARWIAHLSLAEGALDEVPASARLIPAVEAHRIQAHAERALPREQVRALRLWLTGHEYDEIARELGLADERAAARLVNTTIQRLRTRFVGRGGAKKIVRA